MKKQSTTFDYSTLVSYMLPKGILDSFEINRIEEEDLGIKDETGTELRVLHIYLDERDLRDEVWHDLKPNGFTEAREFNDFPVREYKVVLHVRRRRWLSADGKNIILDSPALENHVPHDEDIWLALRGVKPRTSAPEPNYIDLLAR